MVGYAHDAFDKDVICSKFRRRHNLVSKSSEDEVKENTSDGDGDKKEIQKTSEGDNGSDSLKLGKHYIVFMVHMVTSVGQPVTFMVGRYP